MIHEQLYGSADLREVHLAQQANLLMANLFNAFGVDPSRICGQVVVCRRMMTLRFWVSIRPFPSG